MAKRKKRKRTIVFNEDGVKVERREVQVMSPFSPGILVLHEKHGDWHYSVPTEAHLHAAALEILARRLGDNWYYDPRERSEAERQYAPKPPELTDEQIEALPKGDVREAAEKQRRRYLAYQAEAADAVRWIEGVEYALEHKDGSEAWQLLRERHEGEYEGMSIDSCKVAKPLPRPKTPVHGQRWSDPETGQRWIYEAEQGLGWIHGDYARMEFNIVAHGGKQPYREYPVSDDE